MGHFTPNFVHHISSGWHTIIMFLHWPNSSSFGNHLHLCPFLSIGSFLLCTLLNTGVHNLHTVLERITSLPRLPWYILSSLNMFWGIRSYSPSPRRLLFYAKKIFHSVIVHKNFSKIPVLSLSNTQTNALRGMFKLWIIGTKETINNLN